MSSINVCTSAEALPTFPSKRVKSLYHRMLEVFHIRIASHPREVMPSPTHLEEYDRRRVS